MDLRWRWLLVRVVLLAGVLGSGLPAWAETVHLVTGEVIKGKIVRAEAETLFVESDKGFGVLQVRRSDVSLIEFENAERDLSRSLGVGYQHRTTPGGGSAQAAEYGVDALSLKMWLNKTDAVDLQVGFYNNAQKAGAVYQVFSLDLRYATVIKRQAQTDVYMGGSVGFLTVTDKTLGNNLEGSGWAVRGFVGVELFLLTLPNVGISAELGVGMQNVGSHRTTNLSSTSFPALSLRYYF